MQMFYRKLATFFHLICIFPKNSRIFAGLCLHMSEKSCNRLRPNFIWTYSKGEPLRSPFVHSY